MKFNVHFVEMISVKIIFLRQNFYQCPSNCISSISPNSKCKTGFSDKGFHSKSVFCPCNKIEVIGLHAIQQSY